MNRPKIEDSLTRRMYIDDLEKYCDEIEKVDERLTKALINIGNSFCDDIKKLENALDKACDMLETYDLANNELTRPKHSKEEWKEWCLDD